MARRGLVIETDRFRFVGPDNGILTLAAPTPAVKRVFSIEDKRFFEADPSPTFHGRDVFAPVAAHLTLGVDPAEMGPQACDLVALAWPETSTDRGALSGEILFADGFGNLVTNIPGDGRAAGRRGSVGRRAANRPSGAPGRCRAGLCPCGSHGVGSPCMAQRARTGSTSRGRAWRCGAGVERAAAPRSGKARPLRVFLRDRRPQGPWNLRYPMTSSEA
jgi:hypothetical protein